MENIVNGSGSRWGAKFLLVTTMLMALVAVANTQESAGGSTCTRKDPGWIYYHYSCNGGGGSCSDDKYTTGSTCIADNSSSTCTPVSRKVPYYTKSGSCVPDDTGDYYCDSSGSSYSEGGTTTVRSC